MIRRCRKCDFGDFVVLGSQLNCRQKLRFLDQKCKFCSKVSKLINFDQNVLNLANFVNFGYFKDLVMSTELSTKVDEFIQK